MVTDIEAPLVEVVDLHVAYGGLRALQGVSLSVRAGEIVTVIGANGAGKTTLLNAIAGLVKPARGEVRMLGEPIHKKTPATLIRLGLILVPEGRHLFGELTVLDNLRLGAYSCHFSDWNLLSGYLAHHRGRATLEETLERTFTLFPRLRDRAHQLAGSMSGGEQQMLAIGRALMAKPKILLMDEPSMGLAPSVVREMLRLAALLRDSGLTVLLVEQNANQALKIADRAYVLNNGKITLEGTAKELAADDNVRRIYLGGGTFGETSTARAGMIDQKVTVSDAG